MFSQETAVTLRINVDVAVNGRTFVVLKLNFGARSLSRNDDKF